MPVKLREKPGSVSRPEGQAAPEIIGMQHDGTQATATGIVVWAGSEGKTLNLQYRGGDANDWVIVDPGYDHGDDRIVTAGGWLLSDGSMMWLTQDLSLYEIVES